MSRFRKLSQSIWHCQYHIVFIPKYRFEILGGSIKKELENSIQSFCAQQKCEIVELNVQIDHVHLLVMIPPKISISNFMGIIKGRSAIRIFNKFPQLKKQPYWGKRLLR
jgi:putative transposase